MKPEIVDLHVVALLVEGGHLDREKAQEAVEIITGCRAKADGLLNWTDEQCLEFASVCFRHAPKNLPRGVNLNDIRLAAGRVIRKALEPQA